MADVSGDEICYDFKYNSIFDKDGKVKAFIDANRDALKDYFDKYQTILQTSKLFKQNNGKTFGTYQASELSKSVADNAFLTVSLLSIPESSLLIKVASDVAESIVVLSSPNTILWLTSKKALSATDLDNSEAW